jgi:bifunctional non-homologous end joining protein LigD
VLTIEKREGGQGSRLWVDTVSGLEALVDLGVIEVHPWNATVEDIELADQMIFDLDPGPGIEWPSVADTAFQLREFLKTEEDLACWPKATGGKGLHLMVPLKGKFTHDQARKRSYDIATAFARGKPVLTVSSSLAVRPKHIFIDYLRNGRGATAVGAYSPRARAGITLALPLKWSEIGTTAPNSVSLFEVLKEKQ